MARGAEIVRGIELEPEQKLWAAKFAEMLTAALGHAKVSGKSAKLKRVTAKRKAVAWIRSDEDYIGSFVHVCAILNVDPGYVRRLYVEKVGEKTRSHLNLVR